MGRKKITNVELIEDRTLRNITYSKRMRGLVKKAMELAIMCDQQISLVIFDTIKSKLITYNSDEFSIEKANKILNSEVAHTEVFTDKDYNHFLNCQTISYK